jgi:hypothetical protein
MRCSITNIIHVGLLSTLVLYSSCNPVARSLSCTGAACDSIRPIEGVTVKELFTPHREILPRGGGGGRPDKPNDRGPDGTPGGKPGDNNNPSVPNNQNGEEGGFGGQQSTGGGFSNICQKRTWSAIWRRSGCGNVPERPSQAVIRTNNNQPATEGPRASPTHDINLQERRDAFRAEIQQSYQNRPWFFFSGVDTRDAEKWKDALDDKLQLGNQKTGFIKDFVDVQNPNNQRYLAEYTTYKAQGFDDYFWAANSKAFAQAVQGRVYVMIPGDRAINQPYDHKGSNWWSYELQSLLATRGSIA